MKIGTNILFLAVVAVAGGLTPAPALVGHSDTNQPAFTRLRSWTNPAPTAPSITLDISHDTNAVCHTVEEILPDGVTATNIAGDGVWLPNRRAIRWGPFLNVTNQSLSYQITGSSGEHAVGGSSWVDGVWRFAPVATMVPIENDDDEPGVPTRPPRTTSPVFDPVSGTVVPLELMIACATTNAEIRYTTDGTLPHAASTLYTGLVAVKEATLVRARGFAPDHEPSAASWAWYPEADPLAEVYVERVVSTNDPAYPQITITITQETAFACMAFEESLPPGLTPTNITADGVWSQGERVIRWGPVGQDSYPVPLEDESTVGRDGNPVPRVFEYAFTGPPGAYTLTGRWSIDGAGGSGGASAGVPVVRTSGSEYEIRVAPAIAPMPTLDPPLSVTLPVGVTLAGTLPGSQIRYTTDGSDPTASSTLYTTEIPISIPTLLRARTFAEGHAPSAAAWGLYEQRGVEETLTLTRSITNNATHLPSVRVDATPSAGLKCFTVEERLPTGLTPYGIGQSGLWNPTNRTIRWGPVLVGRDSIPSYTYSVSGGSGAYTLDGGGSLDGVSVETTGEKQVAVDLSTMFTVAIPVISPPPDGTFPVTVTIETATEGAAIRYTLDGSMPVEDSPLYSGAFTIDTTARVKARGFKAWMLPSAVGEAHYGLEAIDEDQSSVTRRIFDNGTVAPRIELECSAGEDVLNHAIEEALPAGLTPSEITGGGTFGAATWTIRWGPFRDRQARVMSYRLAGVEGAHGLSGAGSFNGFSVPTGGDDRVTIHNGVQSAVTVSNDWSFHPTVSLSVTPDASVDCYAVEFYLSVSNVPSNISGDGLFNSNTLTIKWGPFLDNLARDFTFDLSGSWAREALSYRVSFNGVSHFFERGPLYSVGLPPPTNVAAIAGNGVAYLTWDATGHEEGINVYYWTQPDRSNIEQVDAGAADGFHALVGLVNGETYSVVLRAYDRFGVESDESSVVLAIPDEAGGFYGVVFFDRNRYDGTNETAEITVWDEDLKSASGTGLESRPTTEELLTIVVHVFSDSDPDGIHVTLRKTLPDSGVFTASAAGTALGFSFTESDDFKDIIRVREGDLIRVKYDDAIPAGLRFDEAQFGEWDSDGDGLPDWWERRYFGGPTSAHAGTLAENGVNTLLQAYISGLDPTDPDAALRIGEPVFGANGVVRIAWSSEPGVIYTIEKSFDLRDGFWPLVEGIPATYPTNTYEDTLDAQDPRPVFYRIVADDL